MPVFLQFRLWLSQGPVRERVLAGAAAGIAVVLLVLVSLPLTDGGGPADTVAAQGPAAASGGAAAPSAGGGELTPAAGGATGGADGATSAGGAPAGAAGSPGSAGQADAPAAGRPMQGTGVAATGDRCSGLTASAPGITEKEVHVDMSMVNIAGPAGNAAFQIRSDLHQIADAVVDDINKNGGVACGRKLVLKKYDVNPVDQNSQQSTCLQMVQDKPFLTIDIAGYITPVARACFVQNKLPFQLSTSAATKELNGGYPYLYGQIAPSEKQVRDGVLGAAELGFFAAPKFQKLGLLEDSCEPEVNAELEADLAKVGVNPNQISKFTLSCQLIAPPNEVTQAVLQHKAAHVSHVFLASSISNSQRYTQFATQQDFHPSYATEDYGSNTASAGDWDPGFAGALAISSTHAGDLNSGIRTPGVDACDRIMKAHGLKGISTEKGDGTATSVCDQFNFFKQAIDKAGANPTRQSFIEQGVSFMGTFHAAGGSDGVFDRAGKVVGGDFHRPLVYDGGCKCFKVRDANFKPGF